MPNYLSNIQPDFNPSLIQCGAIACYQFKGALSAELASGRLDRAQALQLMEDMLSIREFEEMIVKRRPDRWKDGSARDS